MTKHTPEFKFFSADAGKYFDVVRINCERDSFTIKVDGYYTEIDKVENIEINGKRISELEAELAAEKSSHQHTAMCFDQAWDKIIWLREALKRQFCRANAEREKVERLSDIIADLIAGGESAEQADPRLGYIELQTDRETLARAREALAATEPGLTNPRNSGIIEPEGAKSD